MVYLLGKLLPFSSLLLAHASSFPECRSYGNVVVIANTDFYGNDLRSVPASEFDKCIPECAKDPKCKSFTFSPHVKLCFLKTGTYQQSTPKHFVGAVSGYMCSAPDCVLKNGFVSFRNMDLHGNDVRMTTAKDYETCYSKCIRAGDCDAITFNDNNSQCFFKKAESYKYLFTPFKNAWSGYQCGSRTKRLNFIKNIVKENALGIHTMANNIMEDIIETFPNPIFPRFKFAEAGLNIDMQLARVSGFKNMDINVPDFDLNSTPTSISSDVVVGIAFKDTLYVVLDGQLIVSGVGNWIGLGGKYNCEISGNVADVSGKAAIALDMSPESEGFYLGCKMNILNFNVPTELSNPSFKCSGKNLMADKVVSAIGNTVFSATFIFIQEFGNKISFLAKGVMMNIVNNQLRQVAPLMFINKFNNWLH